MGCTTSCVESRYYLEDKSKKYITKKELGSGATCKVLYVEDIETKEPYALKVINKKAAGRRLYNQEVKLLKQMKHHNILTIEDHWESADAFNILTVLCTGGELFDRVKNTLEGRGSFTEGDAAAFVKAGLEAIAYCHENNVVHRDIKLENFVFTNATNYAELKLIDFGCAEAVSDSKIVHDVTGTPYYIAPEVLDEKVTKNGLVWKGADVWSMGIILYIVVCGRPPFTGVSQDQILEKVKKGKYSFPRGLRLSDNVEDLIKNMLNVDYKNRYTAKECLEHEWFKDAATSSYVISNAVLKGVNQFRSQCRLKRAVGRVLADRLTEEDKEELRAAFKKYDTNGDGILGPEEIAAMMKDVGRNDIKSQDIVRLMDEDNDGGINEQEFHTAHAAGRLVTEHDIKQSFDLFDENGDGYITHSEIEHICSFLTPDAVEELIRDVDTNLDGKVNFDEWLIAMGGAKFKR